MVGAVHRPLVERVVEILVPSDKGKVVVAGKWADIAVGTGTAEGPYSLACTFGCLAEGILQSKGLDIVQC